MPVVEFTRVHVYHRGMEGISLPVTLRTAGQVVEFPAHIDTGATNCLFERRHAELLNIDVEAGDRKTFRTATGSVDAYGHHVTIEVFDFAFESFVYFIADGTIRRNLLGRIGWLDRVRLGLIDHDGEIYLAPCDI